MWNADAPSSLAEIYPRFRGTYCIRHRGVNFYETARRKSQKTDIFMPGSFDNSDILSLFQQSGSVPYSLLFTLQYSHA
jgi:hypothetical protein